MTDFTALGIVNGKVVPHANKKEDLIKNINKGKTDMYLLHNLIKIYKIMVKITKKVLKVA